MDLCLYDETLGYYSRNAAQFGKAGDFSTSRNVHAVFGRLLARQFEEMWRMLGSPAEIVIQELGPGRGLFAQDVLDWSEKKFPDFFRALRYVLIERSPALRQRIEETGGHLGAKTAVADPWDTASPPAQGGTCGTRRPRGPAADGAGARPAAGSVRAPPRARPRVAPAPRPPSGRRAPRRVRAPRGPAAAAGSSLRRGRAG